MDIITPKGVSIIKAGETTATLIWNPEFANRMNRILGIGSPLQQFIDETVMTGLKDYMPLLTGTMINSMILNTQIGSGQIITRTPYVRRQFYEGREPGVSQTGALRGRLWASRYKADNWTALVQSARDFVMRGGA